MTRPQRTFTEQHHLVRLLARHGGAERWLPTKAAVLRPGTQSRGLPAKGPSPAVAMDGLVRCQRPAHPVKRSCGGSWVWQQCHRGRRTAKRSPKHTGAQMYAPEHRGEGRRDGEFRRRSLSRTRSRSRSPRRRRERDEYDAGALVRSALAVAVGAKLTRVRLTRRCPCRRWWRARSGTPGRQAVCTTPALATPIRCHSRVAQAGR